jgi:anti-anti-sigma factor
MSESSDIEVRSTGEVILVRIGASELNPDLAEELPGRVDEAADEAPELPVVVDLSSVTYIPSVAIGALVGMWQKYKTPDRGFVLVGLGPQVREVLTICRLTKLFDIRETVEEALAHVRRTT